MKKILYFLPLLCLQMFSQVGIGTTIPTASLDINGDLKIRSIEDVGISPTYTDSILVTDENYVKRMSHKDLIAKSLPSCIKGKFSSSGLINVSLATGSETIPFDQEMFDLNSEFDTTNYEFTATEDGIYDVKIQIEVDNTIGVATEFGVSILKNGSVVNRSIYANVGVLTVNVTPPIRGAQTLLQLVSGDTVSFQIEGSIALGSVDILGNDNDSFFTIHQIR